MLRNSTPAPSSELQEILDWLTGASAIDPLLDLIPLRKHVGAINTLQRPLLHRLKIAELLQSRAEQIGEALQPLLLDAKLPLPPHLATVAQGLIGLRAELGKAWLAIAQDADPAELQRVHRNLLQVCLRGLDNLSQQLMASLLAAVPFPIGLWRNTQVLYHHAKSAVDPVTTYPAEMGVIEVRLKAMLALTVAHAGGMTPRELSFLANYLTQHAQTLQLDPLPPMEPNGWLWIETSLDQPPVPLTRSAPPVGTPIYVRCQALAELAGKHLAQLGEGVPPASLGLPLQTAGSDYRNALERARQCWLAPRKRSYNRQPKNAGADKIEVCIHLGTLWSVLGGNPDKPTSGNTTEVTVSDWALLNEGPAGYAIMHLSGIVSGVVPGCAIGTRASKDAAWQICLVRWARNEEGDRISLGLEILAPHAEAIRIQPQTNHQQSPVAALLLPALPTLGRGEAILAARGEYNLRPFTLLREQMGRLQVHDCTPGHSIVETSSVEVFEFQRQTG